MLMLELEAPFQAATAHLDVLSRPVQQASRRALRKLLLFLQRQVMTQMAQQTGLKAATLTQYQRIHMQLQGMEGQLWLGLNPLPLHEVGKVSWTPTAAGATVAGHLYTGSFYRAIHGPQRKVWVRTSRNRRLGHTTYHRSSIRTSQGGHAALSLLGKPLHDVQAVLDARLSQQAQQRFQTLLEQEINYALQQATT